MKNPKLKKTLFLITLIIYAMVICNSLAAYINGFHLFADASKTYGWEGVMQAFVTYAAILTLYIPILPICLIYDIYYIIVVLKDRSIAKGRTEESFKKKLLIVFVAIVVIIVALFEGIKYRREEAHAKLFKEDYIDTSDEVIEINDKHIPNNRISKIVGYTSSHILIDYDGIDNFFKIVSVINCSNNECNMYAFRLENIDNSEARYKALISKDLLFKIPLNDPGSTLYGFKNPDGTVRGLLLEMADGTKWMKYPMQDVNWDLKKSLSIEMNNYIVEPGKKYQDMQPRLLPDVEEIENDKKLVEQEDNSRINVEELSAWDRVFKNRDKEDMSDAYSFNPKSVNACFNYAEDHDASIAKDISKYVGLAGYYCGIGDGTAFMDVESNYSQYAYDETHEYKYRPYKEKINIKATVYDECSFDVTRPGVDKYSYEYIDSLKTLEEKTAFQYEVYDSAHESTRQISVFSDLPGQEDIMFELTGMMVLNGNNTTEEDFENYARAKTIRIKVGDKIYTKVLEDTYAPQFIDLDYSQKANKPVEVQVEVLDKYPGKVSQDIYVSDIQLGIVFNGSHGR